MVPGSSAKKIKHAAFKGCKTQAAAAAGRIFSTELATRVHRYKNGPEADLALHTGSMHSRGYYGGLYTAHGVLLGPRPHQGNILFHSQVHSQKREDGALYLCRSLFLWCAAQFVPCLPVFSLAVFTTIKCCLAPRTGLGIHPGFTAAATCCAFR